MLVVVLRAAMAAAAASAIIAHRPASRQCILAGSWNDGLPSFWCAELPERTERGGHRQFLVWEEHAAQFGVEFSECAGANILSVGQTSTKATHDLKLVTVQLPAGYVSNTQATRPQRFVNERVQLTEAGQSDLAWQTQESNRVGLSLPMWRDRHLCLRQRHSAERLHCARCSVRRQNTYSRHDRRCPGDEARERHEMDTNRA